MPLALRASDSLLAMRSFNLLHHETTICRLVICDSPVHWGKGRLDVDGEGEIGDSLGVVFCRSAPVTSNLTRSVLGMSALAGDTQNGRCRGLGQEETIQRFTCKGRARSV